jgi:hypothetical protein
MFGYSANRALNHSEHSNRKIDMSAGGGVNSGGWSAAELRRRVAAQMGTTPTGDWFDMATKDELAAVVWEQINRPEFLDAVATTVWIKTISDRKANDLLNSAAVNAEWSVKGIGDLPTNVWITPITDDSPEGRANALLARAAGG